MRRIFGIILTLVAFASAAAQEEFSIFVMDENGSRIHDAYVIAMKDSVTHYANSGSEGTATFTNLTPGRWIFRASHQGFVPDTVSAEVGGDRNAAVIRLKPATELEEVVVQGDKSKIVTHMHDGERFYLSPRALKLPDPYQALAEIPMLKTDVMKGTVSMLDGTSPLIMINGEERPHGGVEMIKPRDIEAVEIISIPEARYALSGVSTIVNIRLKEKVGQYLSMNARTENQVPFHNGSTDAGIEVGNKKFSYYTRASISADYHRRARTEMERENSDYSQEYTNLRKHNNWQWSWFHRINWTASEKDKVAVNFIFGQFRLKAHEESTGESTKGGITTPYSALIQNNNASRHFGASAYYTHTFSSTGKLDVKASYSNNRFTTTDNREEEAFGELAESEISLLSGGNYFVGNVAYTGYAPWGQFTVSTGGNTSWDNVTDRIGLNPKFLYRSSYYGTTFSWSKAFGNWMLYASAAAQWIHLSDKENSMGQLRPWGWVSATWNASSKSSWRVIYNHNNGVPNLQNTNPYTTSTDPLFTKYGNPELKASWADEASLVYMLNTGYWYLSSWITARQTHDAIRPYGITEGDRYILTSINSNNLTVTPGFSLNRSFMWGSAYANFSLPVTKWKGMHRLINPSMTIGANSSFGKFYVSADLMWTIRSEEIFEKLTMVRPMIGVDAVYNVTPNFSVGFGLSEIAGGFENRTKYDDGSFRYNSTRTLLKTFFQPKIMLNWRMQKNQKQKMQFNPDFLNGRTSYSL